LGNIKGFIELLEREDMSDIAIEVIIPNRNIEIIKETHNIDVELPNRNIEVILES